MKQEQSKIEIEKIKQQLDEMGVDYKLLPGYENFDLYDWQLAWSLNR